MIRPILAILLCAGATQGDTLAPVAFGQSNAGGRGEDSENYVTAIDNGCLFWKGKPTPWAWATIVDPIKQSACSTGAIDNEAVTNGSMYIAMANRWRAFHPEDTVRLVLASMGGRGLFSPAGVCWRLRGVGTLHQNLIAKVRAAGVSPRLYIYYGGETDMVGAVTLTSTYSDTLTKLVEDTRDSLGHAPFVIVNVARFTSGPMAPYYDLVEREIAQCNRPADSVYVIHGTYSCTMNTDSQHISAVGQAWLGRRVAETLRYHRGEVPTYRSPYTQAIGMLDSVTVAIKTGVTIAGTHHASGVSAVRGLTGAAATVDSTWTSSDTVFIHFTDTSAMHLRIRYAYPSWFAVDSVIKSTDSIIRPMERLDTVVMPIQYRRAALDYDGLASTINDQITIDAVRAKLAMIKAWANANGRTAWETRTGALADTALATLAEREGGL